MSNYIPPDYSDEDIDEIGGPTEEDEGAIETFLDSEVSSSTSKKENKESNNNNNNNMSQQTPFGTPTGGSNSNWNGWTGGGSSPWNNPNPSTPPWIGQNQSPWNNNNGPSWMGGNNNNQPMSNAKRDIDRQKKVIFCDLLDCLVETFQSGGKPGLIPRGIYDIRLRFEVWDKIACINPDRVFAIVPSNLIPNSNGSPIFSWKIMADYVMCSLSEYLRVPYYCCQSVVLSGMGQSKESLVNYVINKNKIPNETILQIGVNSGLQGQSNSDKLVADRCKIDYIDLGQFLNSY